MTQQTDMLDYVSDNQKLRRREIWRNGKLVAECPATLQPATLAIFDATGPFGTYPDREPALAVRLE